MPTIQFNIPDDINKKLERYSIDNDLYDKRKAIVKILREKFNISIRQGLRNLTGLR